MLMKITIIQVGKTKTGFLHEAEAEYLKRLRPYAEVEVITVKDWGGLERGAAIKKEGEEILEVLARPQMRDFYPICLDERGKQLDSRDFAGFIRDLRDFKGGKVCFLVGGSYGLSENVQAKAGLRLAFGKFTFTHEMIRTMLLEQVYRAFTIIGGKEYHY